jgi:hypothetical protein
MHSRLFAFSHPPPSLQGDPANTGEGGSRPARCTRGPRDRFGIPIPRESGSVIGADRRRSGPSCVLPKGVPQGQTESRGIVLAAICWVTSAQRRCHPQEALYLPTFSHLLVVNKLFSLSLSLSPPRPPSPPYPCSIISASPSEGSRPSLRAGLLLSAPSAAQ